MSYDAIVIGSGAGGLTAALALAQQGKRVVCLEQHYVPGGWCHSFTIGGYRFSPGVHYLGELAPGGRLRQIYEGLGVSGDVRFLELNPDGFDHVLVAPTKGAPLERFDVPKGREKLEARLCERFPADAAAIQSLLATVDRLAREVGEAHRIKGLRSLLTLPFTAPALTRYGWRTTAGLLDAHGVRDPILRAVLCAAACGDVGLPPSLMPAAMYAGVTAHYFDGGWFPQGGGFAIPRAFVRAFKRAGGELRLRTRVEEILTEPDGRGRRAVGVRLGTGEELRAPVLVSNADPHVTFRLVGQEHLSRGLCRKLARTQYSVSAISLFLATDLDLEGMGYDSGNYWYMGTPDLDHIYGQGLSAEATEVDQIPGCFVTITTLKDRTKAHGPGQAGHHTLEMFAFVDHRSFAPWAQSGHKGRPDEYEALKKTMKERLLRCADRVIPGIADHIVFADVGTPLTNEHYVMATRGNLYGTAKTRGQIGPLGFPLQTEIGGLWMCGASTLSHGVLGATVSGLVAAAKILKRSPNDLLGQKGPPLECFLADDPSAWPDAMRRRLGGKGAEALDPADAALAAAAHA